MPSIVGTIIKLLVISLIVGLILKFMDLDPVSLLHGLGGFAEKIMSVFAGFFEWAIGPILVGAVLVVPIWLIAVLWKKTTRRGR